MIRVSALWYIDWNYEVQKGVWLDLIKKYDLLNIKFILIILASIISKWRDTRATHSDILQSLIERQGKIHVTFHKVDDHPSGQYVTTFMIELGIVIKKFAPLQVSKWKELTEEKKMPIFDRLEVSNMWYVYI